MSIKIPAILSAALVLSWVQDGLSKKRGRTEREEGAETASQVAEEKILEKEIREDLTHLAGDPLEGRMAGRPGAAQAADHIREAFKKAGLKQAPGAGWSQPFTFAPRMSVRSSGKLGSGDWKTENVLGYHAGTDPALRSEVVIVGAHFDHIGKAGDAANPGRIGGAEGDDEIFNGANDNASGCSALIAIARALGSGRIRTKRGILLIAFGAEEQGLLGSRHYCDHMIFPAAKTFAMINMDSVGRMRDEKNRTVGVYQVRTSPSWRGLFETHAQAAGVRCTFFDEPWPNGLSSDHVPFWQKQVKSVGLFTGVVPERHRPNDEAERADFEGIAGIARLVLAVACDLADRDRPLD